MVSRTFEDASEWIPDIRSMEVFMGLAFVVLLGALWLFSHDATAPARAAEDALRRATGDETLEVGRPFSRNYFDAEGHRVHRRKLVCSRPGAETAFAAVVHERNRRSISGQMSRFPGRVEAVQTGAMRWPARGPDLMAACQKIGR